ncbi:metallophosphoesterase [Candidatus Cyanaurora vandensis]|uniref:metallophosphoesterase family protein n=1 Tax=Candidatus Cyanaurora vandensis TaxID=2714958 RepID=UPI00257EEA04|nr:metallophosphoesterase [Candidatus Cyanaurora vandensis]
MKWGWWFGWVLLWLTPGAGALDLPPRQDVRVVVISDLNSQYGATDYESQVKRAIALIPTWQPDLVLCSGDMIAGQDSSLSTQQIRAMWAGFDRHIAQPLRQAGLPFGFTLGNHDSSSYQTRTGSYPYQRDRAEAIRYWQGQDPKLNFVDRTGFPFYYTFQQQGVFYLVWDASSAQIPSTQLTWAKRSLASPTAKTAKMRVVIGHLPLYAVAKGRDKPGEVLADAEQLRGLLEQYRVHTYISGHQHSYYPGHRGQLQLLQTSALGSGPRPLISGPPQRRNTLTVVDLDLKKSTTTYTTYDLKTMTVIDPTTLPRFLVGPRGLVLRRDVRWEQLTRQEQATCVNQLGAGRCGP